MPLLLRFRVHRRGHFESLAPSDIGDHCTVVAGEVRRRVDRWKGYRYYRAQIAAAVLILVPAGLAVFANRPAENPLATILLSGVRWFVMLAALSGAVAAAALAGVRATESLQTSLLIYATTSSACLAAVTIAWVGSIGLLRERAVEAPRPLGDCRYRSHRLLIAALAVVANGLVAVGRAITGSQASNTAHAARSS